MYYGAIFSLKQNPFNSLRKLLVHLKWYSHVLSIEERRWTVTAKNKSFQQEGCLVQNPRKLSRTKRKTSCSCANRSELADSKVLMVALDPMYSYWDIGMCSHFQEMTCCSRIALTFLTTGPRVWCSLHFSNLFSRRPMCFWWKVLELADLFSKPAAVASLLCNAQQII